MKPLVSIITPTYNHEEFIADCIVSVLRQDYRDWEMIIIDDASTDKTLSIISKFSKIDKRIRIISHKKNWGITNLKKTYNQALKLAHGELIAILEGDDFWPTNKLRKQVAAFTDKKVVLSYGNWAMTNQSGDAIYLKNYCGFNKNLLNNAPLGSILKLFLTLKFDLGSQTVIIRKKALDKIGGFQNSRFYPFIDIPTYLSLTLVGNFYYLPEVLGYYRRTKQSSWFHFAKLSKIIGREELRNCVNSFTKINSKKLINKLDWEKINKQQVQFLALKRRGRRLSLFFNGVLFKSDLVSRFVIFCAKIMFALQTFFLSVIKIFNLFFLL